MDVHILLGIDFVATPNSKGNEPGVAIKGDCTGMKIVYAYYGDVMFGGDSSAAATQDSSNKWNNVKHAVKKTKASAKYEGSADIFPAFPIFNTGETKDKDKPKNVNLGELKV